MSSACFRLTLLPLGEEVRKYDRTNIRMIWFSVSVITFGVQLIFFVNSGFYHAFDLKFMAHLPLVTFILAIVLVYQFICVVFAPIRWEILMACKVRWGRWRIYIGAVVKAILELILSFGVACLLFILGRERENEAGKTIHLNDIWGLLTMAVLAYHSFFVSRILAGGVVILPLMAACIDICLHLSVDKFKEAPYAPFLSAAVALALLVWKNILEVKDKKREKLEIQNDHHTDMEDLVENLSEALAEANQKIRNANLFIFKVPAQATGHPEPSVIRRSASCPMLIVPFYREEAVELTSAAEDAKELIANPAL